jgi:hypothetical protein
MQMTVRSSCTAVVVAYHDLWVACLLRRMPEQLRSLEAHKGCGPCLFLLKDPSADDVVDSSPNKNNLILWKVKQNISISL